MKARHQHLLERGAAVLVVTFDTVEAAAHFRDLLELPYPVASDAGRRAYRDYGLGKGSPLQIWHPRTLWRYAGLVLGRGMKLRRSPGEADLSQLGGDFVVDGAGLVRLAHRSLRPDDRPPIAALLAALAEARA